MLLQFDNDMHHVMGILNVTPDSFYDGGRFLDKNKAIEQALRMIGEGASIIDVGGESTRPGALPVSLQEESDRVLPVIEYLAKETDITISIDTMKPELMQAAVSIGAKMINDVNALQAEGALEVAGRCAVDICLMHKKGLPRTMQVAPSYQNVLTDITDFFHERVNACVDAGISLDRICLDPGFGFGKTLAHNMTLIQSLAAFLRWGCPVLIGVSRKTSLGEILNKGEMERLSGSLALTAIAYLNGARIFRTHDVKETVDALTVARTVCKQGQLLL